MKLKRKMIAWLLVVAAFASIAPVCLASSNNGDDGIMPLDELPLFVTLDYTGARLNPYSGITDYTLPKGTVVLWTGETASGGWMKVSFYMNGNGSEIIAYVPGSLICPRGECFYTTASNGLNLRESASTSSQIKATIPYNTFVRIHSALFTNGWGYCTVMEGTYRGYTGYVSEDYVAKYDGIYNWWKKS